MFSFWLSQIFYVIIIYSTISIAKFFGIAFMDKKNKKSMGAILDLIFVLAFFILGIVFGIVPYLYPSSTSALNEFVHNFESTITIPVWVLTLVPVLKYASVTGFVIEIIYEIVKKMNDRQPRTIWTITSPLIVITVIYILKWLSHIFY